MAKPRASIAAAALALTLLASACGLYRDQGYPLPSATPSLADLLQDPGFEGAPGAWAATPADSFTVDTSQARTGKQSGALRGAADAFATVTQTVAGRGIPEFVSGFYRVQRWQPLPGQGELGFRVTVHGSFADDQPQHTLHFSIGGLPAAPTGLPATERYVFLSRGQPSVGGWTYFGYPVAAAVEQRFGRATAVESVDITLEVRGDATEAWFDDLYAGTQIDNPNRPPQQ